MPAVINAIIGDFLGLFDQFVHGVVLEFNVRFASVVSVVSVAR
jgi:hypothetical protein